jgi:hypothetical protein
MGGASKPFDLKAVRDAANAYLAGLQDRDGPIGCYRQSAGGPISTRRSTQR